MNKRVLTFIVLAVVAVVAVVSLSRLTRISTSNRSAPTTPWGEPDLQGIWTDEHDTPLQRPTKYAGREFFSDAEIAELDKQRAAVLGREYRDKNAEGRGTEQDVAGAYNAVFESHKRTGRRTSLIVDPPDGRIPPLTPEAEKRRARYREFQLALLQATDSCKNRGTSCREGMYGPISPKRAEPAPVYNTDRLNRADGPEDRSLTERCMGATLPDVSGYRRIVQSPGTVSVSYDVGQGQSWQRIIPVNAGPHLPSSIRDWFGDSRGRWEGKALVVDVSNFSPKADFRGSHENLHLIEHWTRTDANTLEYTVTIEDPTTWARPWTITYEMTKQDDQANRFYMEPRCHEGNYGLVGILWNTRVMERAFAEGHGPDPATRDISLAGAGGGDDNQDPLLQGR
jgi:hypothetical protein